MTWDVHFRGSHTLPAAVETFADLATALAAARLCLTVSHYTLMLHEQGSEEWLTFAQANHLAHYGTIWGELKLQPDGSII